MIAIALCYGIWRSMLATDVARVKTSIDYQYQHLRIQNPSMTLKADSVSPSGFPFHFRVAVARATLSMVSGEETYAVSIPELTLEPIASDEGRYRVIIPPTFDALYASSGKAPENYTVTAAPMPALQLRAWGTSLQCSNFPGGEHCPPVAADAPLITFAVQVPRSLLLHMQLNGESKDASFTLIPLDIPMFENIPADMSGPLQLFIGILREALVFKTGSQQP